MSFFPRLGCLPVRTFLLLGLCTGTFSGCQSSRSVALNADPFLQTPTPPAVVAADTAPSVPKPAEAKPTESTPAVSSDVKPASVAKADETVPSEPAAFVSYFEEMDARWRQWEREEAAGDLAESSADADTELTAFSNTPASIFGTQSPETEWDDLPIGVSQTDLASSNFAVRHVSHEEGGEPIACSGFSLRDDLRNWGPNLLHETRGIVNWPNAIILGAAAGGAVAVKEGWDDNVRACTAKHPERWGSASDTIGDLGDWPVQVPALLSLYGYSLLAQNEQLHDVSTTLIDAYVINGVTTVLIKAAANTDRPTTNTNNGHYGFPSFHTSSSFTIAAVLDEYYGWQVGVPAYLLAGTIGWTRIDERDHDLSDVLFGAALGYVVGKSVAGQRLYGDGRVQVIPYYNTHEQEVGLIWEKTY